MNSTRMRMIDAAIEGLRRGGVAGTSFSEIVQASGAARGAIYHHFPGGKSQLVAEAAAANGEQVRAVFAALTGDTPAEVVRSFFDQVRPAVEVSACGGGCAVAAVAVGDSGDPDLREVAHVTFTAWTETLTERLKAAGLGDEDARDLATTLLAILEGAHVLARAAASTAPFDQTARTIVELAGSLETQRPQQR